MLPTTFFFDGARDQIRIHRKHCFRYLFEGYALSYSPLANRSYSQPTGYSPLFRWHALNRKGQRKTNIKLWIQKEPALLRRTSSICMEHETRFELATLTLAT